MTAQFRIGGHYRDGNGNLCAVLQHAVPGRIAVRFVDESDPAVAGMSFDHDAVSGQYLDSEAKPVASSRFTLLPGELTLKDGQWVPVAEEAPKPAEREPKWVLAARARVAANRAADPTYEKLRPRLTWATPKPVDRWEGFTVRSWMDFDELGKYGPDAPAHSHPLQRMTDPSDPAHGSAWLKAR